MRIQRMLFLLALYLLGCDVLKAKPESEGGPPPVQVAAWDGTYVGTWTASPLEPGRPTPVVEYRVVVSGNYISVSADGTQTAKRMTANAVPGGTSLGAAFADCRPDDMFRCEGLVKGDRLFTVTNIHGVYLLRFEKMVAPDDATKEISLTKQK